MAVTTVDINVDGISSREKVGGEEKRRERNTQKKRATEKQAQMGSKQNHT